MTTNFVTENNWNLFSHNYGDQKSEIKPFAGLHSLGGLWGWILPCFVQLPVPPGVPQLVDAQFRSLSSSLGILCVCVFSSVSYKNTCRWIEGSASRYSRIISSQDLTFNCICKNRFPNKVTFTGSNGQDTDVYFLGLPFNPLQVGLE